MGIGWLSGLVAACALAGCGATRPPVRYDGPVTSGDLERGRNRYHVVCGPCHEDQNDRHAPLFATIRLPAAAIRRQVREGDAQMPAIPMRRLPDADLEALLAFLRVTGTCTPETLDAWSSH